jgi:hypothetical protein
MQVAEQRQVIETLGVIKLKGSLLQPQAGVSGHFEIVVSNELDWSINQNFGQFGSIESKVTTKSGMNKRLRHSYQLKGILQELALREHPFNFLYWEEIYESVSVNTNKKADNNIVAVLKGRKASDATVLIDGETGHMIQIDMLFVDPVWGEYPRSISYADYLKHCGVNIPRKFEIDDHETGNTVFKITDVTTEFCDE